MYTETDIIDEFSHMEPYQFNAFIDIVSKDDINNILYYFPEDVGKFLYTNMNSYDEYLFQEFIPDMIPPTDYQVLESIDNMIYVLQSDEYMEKCRYNKS